MAGRDRPNCLGVAADEVQLWLHGGVACGHVAKATSVGFAYRTKLLRSFYQLPLVSRREEEVTFGQLGGPRHARARACVG